MTTGLADRTKAAALLDVEQVAQMLACSKRHVYRLSDAALMPRPVRLGTLVRWPRAVIDQWIADGCPAQLRQGGDDAQ